MDDSQTLTKLACSGKELECSYTHVTGDNNIIAGDYNVIVGDNNKAVGKNNVVRGKGANVSGEGSVYAAGPGGHSARVIVVASADGTPPAAERRLAYATGFEVVVFMINPTAEVDPRAEAGKYIADHLAIRYSIKDIREYTAWHAERPPAPKNYHCLTAEQLRPTTCASLEIRRKSATSMKIMHVGSAPTVEHLGSHTRVNGFVIPGTEPYIMTYKDGYTVLSNLRSDDLDGIFGDQDVVTV